MNDGLTVLSYTLAAFAGVCFVSGLAILRGGRVNLDGQIRTNYIHAR